ncbi:hypothetical protein LXA43DRAFT_1186480 [Ganoderma leucocontextum]|nr:hypothetical protein LXA43DRAFT_1186480 [Ganoderma leucocontextum]
MTDRTPNNGMPGDVLLAIFSSLDVCDLVSCRQVCWQFSQVIASDLSLQYRMALAFNGLVEPSASESNMSLGLPERLEGVRKYEAKLERVKFSCTATQLLDHTAGHLRWQPIASTSGSIAHIVTKSTGDHMLSVYLPSSLSNGDIWQSWDIPLDLPGIPVRPECVAVDPLQDLLVVAETVRDIWDLRICLLSLSSGGRASHPSATEPILKYCTPSGSVGMILPQAVTAVRIFAQYVAVVAVGNDEEPEELLVWDWRTGSLSVMTVAPTRSPTLALLDESHLAVSRSWTSDLDVYCVGSWSVVEHCAGSCHEHRLYSRKLCTLSVSGPPFDGAKWTVANIFSEFQAKHHTDAACQSSSSFRAQPSSAAVVFQLTTGAPDHFKKTVVLDSSSLHDVFRDAHQSRPLAKGTTRPALPFAEWGSGSLVLDERAKPGPYLHVADVKPYGSKVVLLSYPPSNATERTGHPAHPRVHVLDIDRWVAKRTRALVGDAEGDLLVQCWEKGTEMDCFVDPLPSGRRLPFAVYKGPTITFPDGHYPVGCIASQSGFSLMFVDLLSNKPAGFQTWTLV